MNVSAMSRIWKKADLFRAMVELHAAGLRRQKAIDPALFAQSLTTFYAAVDDPKQRGSPESDPSWYYKVALQATNDRNSRATPENYPQTC